VNRAPCAARREVRFVRRESHGPVHQDEHVEERSVRGGEVVVGGEGRQERRRELTGARVGEVSVRGPDRFNVWVQIDLPGVAADSVDITVERSVLTVSAERSWQREEGDQVYLAERHRGSFRRQVHLGEGLDADNIEADFTDGVLTLRIPVAEQARARKISVATGRTAIDVESSVAGGGSSQSD
jgi:HSP20 family molecular chaperone IbpA